MATYWTSGHLPAFYLRTEVRGKRWAEEVKLQPFKTQHRTQLSPGSFAEVPPLPSPTQIWLSWGLIEMMPTQFPAH